jgi:hypothetical protein
MPVVAELSAVAWPPPPLIVSVTVLVAVEIIEIDPVYPLPTQTWEPSGVAGGGDRHQQPLDRDRAGDPAGPG